MYTIKSKMSSRQRYVRYLCFLCGFFWSKSLQKASLRIIEYWHVPFWVGCFVCTGVRREQRRLKDPSAKRKRMERSCQRCLRWYFNIFHHHPPFTSTKNSLKQKLNARNPGSPSRNATISSIELQIRVCHNLIKLCAWWWFDWRLLTSDLPKCLA